MDIAKVPFGMSLVLVLLVGLGLAILWNFHRDRSNQVDLKDLICHDGKLNEVKVTRFGAFVVTRSVWTRTRRVEIVSLE